MTARYEELTTPEAVLAAFEAGRRVEVHVYVTATEKQWMPSSRRGNGYSESIGFYRRAFRSGTSYRAVIEEPATPEALASEIESLPQFVPYVQKHRHAAKGYVVGMRRPNRRDVNDERDVYVRKDDVLNLFRRLRAPSSHDDPSRVLRVSSILGFDLPAAF